jgi:hypothetical protein
LARTLLGELQRQANKATFSEGGDSFETISGIAPPTTQGEPGDTYIQVNTESQIQTVYVKGEDNTWVPVGSARPPATTFENGPPSGGMDGDVWFHTSGTYSPGGGSATQIYQKIAGSWVLGLTLSP